MRKKYNEQNNSKIIHYFVQLLMNKYIIPSLILLLFVFTGAILGFGILTKFISAYSITGFVYMICVNVLITMGSISVYHTIKTSLYGYKQITNRKYTVLQLDCLSKRQCFWFYKCKLSDGREYRLYDKNQYKQIVVGKTCDLITITNEYGAKLWEVVINSNL